MKLLATLALAAAFATTAFAQINIISIQAPVNGTTVRAGSNITVEVIQHPSDTELVQVALAIGLGVPNSAPAIGGNILYNGPFNPQFQTTGQSPPTANLQNFTVTIPATTPPGLMSLNVAHFDLITPILVPHTETVNVTLNVV